MPIHYRHKKSPLRFVVYILIILTALIFSGKWYYRINLNPVNPDNDQAIIFSVDKGESIRSIARRLEEKQVIRSDLVFYFYVKRFSLGEKFKAGKFLIYQNKSLPEIVDILTQKVTGQLVLTIPEGFTIRQVDARLAELGLIKAGEFFLYSKTYPFANSPFNALQDKNSLEGWLFPDTYFLDPSTFSLSQFADRLLENFFVKTVSLNIPPDRLYETLIMASIIEKEVRTKKDLPIVAGILWKRLENGWPLQSDATLLYVTNDSTITEKDLEMDSPYNTRKFKGLPPTPISNPGLEAIKGAWQPQSSPYWFYLTKPDTGEVVYAVSNEEQNENRRKYLH